MNIARRRSFAAILAAPLIPITPSVAAAVPLTAHEVQLLKHGVLPQCDGPSKVYSEVGGIRCSTPCQLRRGHEGPHSYSWAGVDGASKDDGLSIYRAMRALKV